MEQNNDVSPLVFSRKGRILIVDDMQVNIIILRQLLSQEYEIATALSGQEALALCHSFKPDLLLLDIEMPGMSGFEVCRRLKSEPGTQEIAVIFVSAHHDEEQEVSGFVLGAVDFIHKPLNAVVTQARVKNQMLLKRQSDLLRFMLKQEATRDVSS
ncbi:response regulator [Shewanella alkalitolerans]|uniref:response regulator n=1 Tax=Shewanella alkalitolerans TaxID=2864209 RepID=UPI001C6550DB|nr:response regulator [Shewanella alkalitolerans]QYJ98595.1 response regulator [Shewanella alkalitolerans]